MSDQVRALPVCKASREEFERFHHFLLVEQSAVGTFQVAMATHTAAMLGLRIEAGKLWDALIKKYNLTRGHLYSMEIVDGKPYIVTAPRPPEDPQPQERER